MNVLNKYGYSWYYVPAQKLLCIAAKGYDKPPDAYELELVQLAKYCAINSDGTVDAMNCETNAIRERWKIPADATINQKVPFTY